LRSNGAIEGAAAGFAPGDDVIVMSKCDGTDHKVIARVGGIVQCSEVPLLRYIFMHLWSLEGETGYCGFSEVGIVMKYVSSGVSASYAFRSYPGVWGVCIPGEPNFSSQEWTDFDLSVIDDDTTVMFWAYRTTDLAYPVSLPDWPPASWDHEWEKPVGIDFIRFTDVVTKTQLLVGYHTGYNPSGLFHQTLVFT
jgi:hypothetical protein